MLEMEVKLFKRNSHCDECNHPYKIVPLQNSLEL